MKEITSRKQLIEKLKLLDLPRDTRNSVVCSLIGHSLIQTHCFGYFNCARCGTQVGDNLASTHLQAEKTVIVGHDCTMCRENFKKLTWRDKVYSPNPFTKTKKEKS